MQRNGFVITVILFLLSCSALAQTVSDYDALVQSGNSQLQAGSADLALSLGEMAIKMNADRWEAYGVTGKALVSLKRYEEAADRFSTGIEKAPPANQPELRELRRQALLAESGTPPAAAAQPQPVPSQPAPLDKAPQSASADWKTAAPALVAALNAQGQEIVYDDKHWDKYSLKYQSQEIGEDCKLRLIKVNSVQDELRMYRTDLRYAYIDEGLLNLANIDLPSIQVNGNMLTISGKDYQDIFLGDTLHIENTKKQDPFDLAMSCIAGTPVKGSECSSEPAHYRTVALFIPDGAQTAQALADQINRVATMCGSKR